MPQLLEKANSLSVKVSDKLRDLKNSALLTQKLSVLSDVLKAAESSPLKNESFFSNLTEVSTTLDQITYQVDKYLRVNAIKRKFIASATRHKIANLLFSLSFQIRLIDAVYVNPPVVEG